jgi:hypothetical protein
MKRILSTVMMILLCIPVISQDQTTIIKPTKKGNYILGGSVKISYKSSFYNYMDPAYYSSTYRSKSIDFNICPQIGYFIADGLALGLSPVLHYQTSRSQTTKNQFFGIGSDAFIKYYLNNPIFFELQGGYLHQWQPRTSESEEDISNSYSIVPGIGYSIFLNSKVSLEPMINYEYRHYTSSYGTHRAESSTNSIFFSIQFIIFL